MKEHTHHFVEVLGQEERKKPAHSYVLLWKITTKMSKPFGPDKELQHEMLSLNITLEHVSVQVLFWFHKY